MKALKSIFLAAFVAVALFGFTGDANKTEQYKCMIQMVNYTGEGAYIIVSVINPEGNYDQTVRILGDDPEWYHEIDEWWKFFGAQQNQQVDAITGATLSGGERSINVLNIAADKFGKGYKLRFETSVEDGEYHVKDIEIPLTKEALAGKIDGSGYIRYVRFMAVK